MDLLTQLLVLLTISLTYADYWTDRQTLIEKERSQALGSRVVLTVKEEKANAKLMAGKYREYDEGFLNPGSFPPARHFFQAKRDIERSEVFKMLRKFPKGASLHSHDTAVGSFDILYNLTYSEKLYGCTVKDRLKLQFFEKNGVDSTCKWKLLKDLRNEHPKYDVWLKKQLSLVVDNPRRIYTDTNKVWQEFINRFMTVTSMLTYRPVFEEYFYRSLQELYEDNVMYLELRSTLPEVYELNGTKYGPVDVVGLYKHTTDRFKKDHPDFFGVKIIYAPARGVSNKTCSDYVSILQTLKSAHGDFVAGFDLVGEEEQGQPLAAFVAQLQEVKSRGFGLFFHAGETNWYGTSTDLNLVDAVLLGTTRIGHGFALIKHPEVLKLVQERGIGIELNPISNQVLTLVDDLRNHPGNFLLANDYPVVICNDDPQFWGAKGLSHDWYQTFMGMMSREADLKALKQLALNSLHYSSIGNDVQRAKDIWYRKWNAFIDELNENA